MTSMAMRGGVPEVKGLRATVLTSMAFRVPSGVVLWLPQLNATQILGLRVAVTLPFTVAWPQSPQVGQKLSEKQPFFGVLRYDMTARRGCRNAAALPCWHSDFPIMQPIPTSP